MEASHAGARLVRSVVGGVLLSSSATEDFIDRERGQLFVVDRCWRWRHDLLRRSGTLLDDDLGRGPSRQPLWLDGASKDQVSFDTARDGKEKDSRVTIEVGVAVVVQASVLEHEPARCMISRDVSPSRQESALT